MKKAPAIPTPPADVVVPASAPPEEKPEIRTRAEILAEVDANPYLYLDFAAAGLLFGFGKDVFTAAARVDGCPIVARKVNPRVFRKWLKEHGHEL